MKLDDINKQINSAVINNLLEDKFGVKINFDNLTKAQLSKLRESIAKAHAKTVKSMPFNSGHRNPEYLEQIALLEAIELRINEADSPFAVDVDVSKDINEVEKEKEPKHVMNPNLTGRQSSALLGLVGKENISKARQAIRLAAQGKSIPSTLVKGFEPIVNMLLDILQGGSSFTRRLQQLDKQAAHAAHLDESRNLFEGETEKAQLIMAVKDMVDRVQGMVEDLSKMKVEDLVALTDKMRDEFGQDAATNFMNSAGTTLSTAIDTLTNARTEMDNAALGLTGEGGTPADQQMGADMAAPEMGAEAPGAEAPGGEMPAPELGAELPAEEPGRGKRESKEYRKNKILESNRFFSKLAK